MRVNPKVRNVLLNTLIQDFESAQSMKLFIRHLGASLGE
jgi:hypothetical protein